MNNYSGEGTTVKKVITLAALVIAAFSITALTTAAVAQGAASGWQLVGKDSDRNSEYASADVYSANVDYPVRLKVVGLATRKSELTWRVNCYKGDFSSSRSSSRRMPANRKVTVYPPVTVSGAEYCFVTAGVDTGWSFSGKRATASVWVLAS